MVAGLLMLATLLLYAVPGHAALVPHGNSGMPHQQDVAAGFDAVDAGRGQLPCEDAGLVDTGACCSIVQCTAMHAGLLGGAVIASPAPLALTNRLPAPPMPEGIATDPARRPPRPTI